MNKANKILAQSVKYENLIKNSFLKYFRPLITGRSPVAPTGLSGSRLPVGAKPVLNPQGKPTNRGWKQTNTGWELEHGYEWDAATNQPVPKVKTYSVPEGFKPVEGGKLTTLNDAEKLNIFDDTGLIDFNRLPENLKRLPVDEARDLRKEISDQNTKIRKTFFERQKQERAATRSRAWTELSTDPAARRTLAGTAVVTAVAGIYYLFSGQDAPTDDPEKLKIVQGIPNKELIQTLPKPEEIIVNLNNLHRKLQIANSLLKKPENKRIVSQHAKNVVKIRNAIQNFSTQTLDLDTKESVVSYMFKLKLLEKNIIEFKDSLFEIEELATNASNVEMEKLCQELDDALSQYIDVMTELKSASQAPSMINE